MSHPRLCTRRSKAKRQPQKKGVVLVCVIVCLAVVALILAGMLKRTLLTRQQIRTERNARQTQWLVQAGAERAAFFLARDSKYKGEQWSLPADAIAGTEPGAVSISVSRDATDRANVQIVAEYPSGNVFAIRRTREFLIDLSQNQ